jgi:hypothetical protein
MPPGFGADRTHSRILHPERTPLLEEADPSPRTHAAACKQATTLLRDAPSVTKAQTLTSLDSQEVRKRTADVSGEHDPDPRGLAEKPPDFGSDRASTTDSSTRNAPLFPRKLVRAPEFTPRSANRPRRSSETHSRCRKG